MSTTPPNFGDVPSPERDLEAPYDHERAAKEFLDATDRISSQVNTGSIPFDNNVITAAYVNATIGVGEAILAILQELRSRSRKRRKARDQKKRRRVEPLGKIKILEEVKGETYDRSPLPPTQGMSCVLAGRDRGQTRRGRRQAAVISVADPAVRLSVCVY